MYLVFVICFKSYHLFFSLQVYTECLPSCVDKCHYMNDTCIPTPTVSCVPGCTCASGTAFNGTFCVHPSTCPCIFDGYFRKSGFRWVSNCNECVCWNNSVICKPKDCTPVMNCLSPQYQIVRVDCCDVCVPVQPPEISTPVPTPAICLSSEFSCEGNRSCISKQWLCDGEEDCSDLTDEKSCLAGVSICNHVLGKRLCYFFLRHLLSIIK